MANYSDSFFAFSSEIQRPLSEDFIVGLTAMQLLLPPWSMWFSDTFIHDHGKLKISAVHPPLLLSGSAMFAFAVVGRSGKGRAKVWGDCEGEGRSRRGGGGA